MTPRKCCCRTSWQRLTHHQPSPTPPKQAGRQQHPLDWTHHQAILHPAPSPLPLHTPPALPCAVQDNFIQFIINVRQQEQRRRRVQHLPHARPPHSSSGISLPHPPPPFSRLLLRAKYFHVLFLLQSESPANSNPLRAAPFKKRLISLRLHISISFIPPSLSHCFKQFPSYVRFARFRLAL